MFGSFRFDVRVYGIAFDVEVRPPELPRLWQQLREIAASDTAIADKLIDSVERSRDDNPEWTQSLVRRRNGADSIDRVTTTRKATETKTASPRTPRFER